jgi:endonuclease III related protein
MTAPSIKRRGSFLAMYRALRARFGHRHWWPGRTPFEVMVGAVLTQNTAWSNVEKAIANLKRAKKLSPRAIHAMDDKSLAALIRPSGYYNVKARRLKALVAWFVDNYGGRVSNTKRRSDAALREELLAVNGVGPETADSILLYALGRPVFVVDAYTRRIYQRHGWLKGGEEYDEIRAMFESNLPRSLALYNDYHAQIVAAGHHYCARHDPDCGECPLGAFSPLTVAAGGPV